MPEIWESIHGVSIDCGKNSLPLIARAGNLLVCIEEDVTPYKVQDIPNKTSIRTPRRKVFTLNQICIKVPLSEKQQESLIKQGSYFSVMVQNKAGVVGTAKIRSIKKRTDKWSCEKCDGTMFDVDGELR